MIIDQWLRVGRNGVLNLLNIILFYFFLSPTGLVKRRISTALYRMNGGNKMYWAAREARKTRGESISYHPFVI